MTVLRRIGRLFWPADRAVRYRRLELLMWAFLLSLAYYPGPFGVLAWISLARPFMILSKLEGKAAFRAAWWYGFFFSLFSLYWVMLVTPPGMLAAVVIVATYYAVTLALFVRVYHWKHLAGFIAAPLLWVGLEYFRTQSEFAFPWSDIGYTQGHFLMILQIVSVISVHGLSLLIVGVNVLVWQALRSDLSPERRYVCGMAGVAVIVALTAYGWIVIPAYPPPGTKPVAILQGGVPLDIKWDLERDGYSLKRYDSLARSVQSDRIALYIWTESAAPCYLNADYKCADAVARTARETNGTHLIGALAWNANDGNPLHYNSCFQVGPSGTIEGRYDKVKLVPFSEAVPYQEQLPFLRREFLTKFLTFIETYGVQWWSDFRPGDSLRLFSVPDFTYGVLICFESTFPEYARQMIRQGADIIVGITNDTWFGTSVGIHMHARFFVTRAVENRCWMARSANTGLSFIVDPWGRLRTELEPEIPVAAVGMVAPLDGYSVFTETGDIAGRLGFAVWLSLLGITGITWLIGKFWRHG